MQAAQAPTTPAERDARAQSRFGSRINPRTLGVCLGKKKRNTANSSPVAVRQTTLMKTTRNVSRNAESDCAGTTCSCRRTYASPGESSVTNSTSPIADVGINYSSLVTLAPESGGGGFGRDVAGCAGVAPGASFCPRSPNV